jgi:hypothetical protein
MTPLVISQDQRDTCSSIRFIQFPANQRSKSLTTKTSDRLSLTQLEIPILYPTHFSRTGWGKQVLEPKELRLAFELPDNTAWNPEFA